MRKKTAFFLFLFVFSFAVRSFGSDIDSRLTVLEETIKQQGKTIEEQQKVINGLKEELGPGKRDEAAKTGGKPQEEARPQEVTGFFGGSSMTNPNISLVLDTFYYSSNRKDAELVKSGIPGFTTVPPEQNNGFNLRAAELFLFSPVDPYFNLYSNLPVTEDGIELEEAYFVTTSLPEGLQVKGGKFKSNFSRLDAQHPHAWDFADIALPYRAFLGPEGLGGEKGVQVTYLPSLPVYTLLGAEALQGENDLLFGKDAQSGSHGFSFFIKSSFETTENSTFYFGPSVLFGKTRNTNILDGAEFSGKSALYGMEAVWKWKPSKQQGLILQSEYLSLTQNGNLTDAVTANVDSLKRRQDGFYAQGIYQLDRWRFGARYDMLELFADSFEQAGIQQNLGTKPWRVTGSVDYNPTEFSRIRFQYTRDRSARDDRANNEFFVQLIFGIGAHAAHAF
ncbi:MAG: hypothetical protein AABY87_06245 [bacterium]